MRFSWVVAACSLCAACGPTKDSRSPAAPTTTGPAIMTPAQPTPTTTGLRMTVSPIDIAAIQSITALGAMAPWGHTLPTDHIYITHHEDLGTNYAPVPVYAPAAGTIEFTSNGRVDVVVDSVFRYWIGPLALAEGIRSGARVEAGALLGHHSTFPSFDFAVLRSTLRLDFVNPLRYGRDTVTSDSPLQYFDEPVRSALYAKVKRSGAEKNGQLNYDVAGTLAGNWYAEDLPVAESGRGGEMYYGVRKLSFARDVFSPDRQRVSIGGLGFTGLWGVPADAPQFSAITPATGFFVYRLLDAGVPLGAAPTTQRGWLLVQLMDANRLRIQALSMEASPLAPSAFTPAAETYLR